MKESHTITITEEDRQMIIMALARLAIDRPGWLQACNDVALQMDNRLPGDEAEMFHGFLKFRLSHVVERLEGQQPTHRVSTLDWRNAARDLPENNRTVMLHCASTRFGEVDQPDLDVWLGYYDRPNNCWNDVEANELSDVTHWAKMPQSPEP